MIQQPVDFVQPAVFFPDPTGPGVIFDHLSEALTYACDGDKTHPQGFIRTRSGAHFGWDAIKTLRTLLPLP